MKSSIVKRSVVIGGHKTSISLEEPFWIDLKQIAHAQHMTLSALVAQIDDTREQSNLSSAIRVFVLHHFRRLFLRPPASCGRDSSQLAREISDVNVYEAEFGLQVLATSGSGPSGESSKSLPLAPSFGFN
jgi:predicted DNA-binding ribbon-helix-helix protein